MYTIYALPDIELKVPTHTVRK